MTHFYETSAKGVQEYQKSYLIFLQKMFLIRKIFITLP